MGLFSRGASIRDYFFKLKRGTSLRDGLLFEITFANSRRGLLYEIKATGFPFEVLRYTFIFPLVFQKLPMQHI